MLIADAGYKTPGIAKLLIDDGVKPLLLTAQLIETDIGNTRTVVRYVQNVHIRRSVQKAKRRLMEKKKQLKISILDAIRFIKK